MSSINTNTLKSVKDNVINKTISMNQLPLELENMILDYKNQLEFVDKNRINMNRIRASIGFKATEVKLTIIDMENVIYYNDNKDTIELLEFSSKVADLFARQHEERIKSEAIFNDF